MWTQGPLRAPLPGLGQGHLLPWPYFALPFLSPWSGPAWLASFPIETQRFPPGDGPGQGLQSTAPSPCSGAGFGSAIVPSDPGRQLPPCPVALWPPLREVSGLLLVFSVHSPADSMAGEAALQSVGPQRSPSSGPQQGRCDLPVGADMHTPHRDKRHWSRRSSGCSQRSPGELPKERGIKFGYHHYYQLLFIACPLAALARSRFNVAIRPYLCSSH